MKKLIVLLLAASLILLSFAGCGSNASSSAESTAPAEAETLKVAMDLKYPPFTGMDDNGNPEGLEVDIAYAMGEYLGRPVEIINTDFSMLITALDTGEADIVISDMGIKEERKEKVDFTDPYLYSRTLALVNKNYAEANGVNDSMTQEEFFALKDARYVGLSGTISISIPESYGFKVEELTEIASGIMEISNGTADILIGETTLPTIQASYPDTTMIYWGIENASAAGMAVKKGNTELLEKANAFIASMYKDGGFYKTANGKYDAAIGALLLNDKLGLDYMVTRPED